MSKKYNPAFKSAIVEKALIRAQQFSGTDYNSDAGISEGGVGMIVSELLLSRPLKRQYSSYFARPRSDSWSDYRYSTSQGIT